MVELRKRKPSQVPAAPPPAKKKANPVKAVVDKAKAAISGEKTNGTAAASPSKVAVGESILFDKFGGEIETNDGVKTSLKQLVDESQAGVVLFTYPKASTPGCTTQACLFRDAYTHLTSTGLAIYGLSSDSPKANTTFKTKQNLPYPLLCDPSSTLISAIGLKKAPKGTTRGVFVVDKKGKVLASEPGGPQATVDIVASLIKDGKVGGGDNAATADAIKAVAAEAPVTEKEDTNALGSGAAAGQESKAEEPLSTSAVTDTVPATANGTAAPGAATAGTDTTMTDAPPSSTSAPTAAAEEPPKLEDTPLIKTPSKEEEESAQTASEVADSARMLDKSAAGTPAPTGASGIDTDGTPALGGEKVAAA